MRPTNATKTPDGTPSSCERSTATSAGSRPACSHVRVNLVTNISAGTADEWNAWWSVWALLGWSIGIAVHGFVVWLNRPSFAASTTEEIDVFQERRTR